MTYLLKYVIIYIQSRENPRRVSKAEREKEMNKEMTENQTKRLIEWLKANGMSAEKIVECMTYINTTKPSK